MDTSTALEASPPSSPSSSSSSSTTSSSSSSSPYDVFLSFSGEDTRKTFTDHLYWTMKDSGIDFFMEENESTRRGENISDKVKQIIEGSRVSVIVFSSRYADSIWCLEELVQIMECRRTLKQIVLPIFYDLSPSDAVGTFAQAFQKYRKRFHKDAADMEDKVKRWEDACTKEEKIQRWADACSEAAHLTTWVFRTTDGYEGMFIRKIVDVITRRLKFNSPIPIGTGFSELQEIDSPVLKLQDGHSSMPDWGAVLPTEPFTSRTFSDSGEDHGSKIRAKIRLRQPPYQAAFSSSSWKYDVFLNFRGEDTRKIFVGHLYRALDQKAINTFIDVGELRKGNDPSEFLAAIENSRLSIVVFSQNYASSTWCLKELVKILECMDANEQIVVPIFYEVDPSQVRKQKRSFAEAFAQHERKSNAEMEELERWRSALTRVSNVTGWDSRKYMDDAKLIEEIVDDVCRLIQVSSSKDNGLVGMDYHIDEMNSLLRPGVNDVFAVGIWGMGGIGKTTIARAVYDEIACQFEACCFLENVKEGFSNNGAVHMQEVLLSRILKEKVQSLGTLDRGSRVIMERLQKKKVFIVLDDVDELSQIEALIGKLHSFGGGSRVIITTRDKQLLSGDVAVYKPDNLSMPEALKLFKQYAFRTNQPTGVYDQLSRRVVQYAQGLPLALKLFGTFLYNKTVHEWEDVLEKIRRIPHKGIHNVLKTSFDGLDNSEKDIFLDIACFLKGMDIDSATKILDSCGFHPHTGIRVLIDRALIFVSEEGILDMHDLLEEMGRKIVCQESIEEPGRRSRLWSYEDVHHVLTQNTATEAVQGIILDSAIFKEACSNTERFVRMTKLRLLFFRQSPNDCFIKHGIADLKFQSSQLRCLLWRGCPQKSWPSNFQFENLVNLDMSNSCIEQLWTGAEPLEKLKFINLSYCKYLKKTPDFSKATSLEELNLEGCTRLCEVDPSISALKNLAILNLRDCQELKSLPSIIHMESLRAVNFSRGSNLEKFPDISDVMERIYQKFRRDCN